MKLNIGQTTKRRKIPNVLRMFNEFLRNFTQVPISKI